MNFHSGHIWFALGIILIIAEVSTPGGFVLACFGISCLVAGISYYLNFEFIGQLVIFCIFSLILFFSIRNFFKKIFFHSDQIIKTNIDALIGKIGIVSERIDPATMQGRVIVGGDDWKGVSCSDEVIEKNAKVIVVEVKGTNLIVKKK